MLITISWVLLGASVCSFWLRRIAWVWGILVLASLMVSLFAGVLQLKGLVPIILLALCHLLLKHQQEGVFRLFVLSIATVISLSMYLNLLSGYGSIMIETKGTYMHALSYDLAFMGVFVLAFRPDLLSCSKEDQKKVLFSSALAIISAFLIVFLSSKLHLWQKALHFSPWDIVAYLALLILSVIPQEAFFRGFLQKEIATSFPHRGGTIISIIAVSLLVALCMGFFFMSLKAALFMLITNLFLGTIFSITKKIEYSIATHAIITLFLMFLFAIP